MIGTNDTDRVLRPSASTSIPVDTEELNELRRTATELREVVRYLKRERDLLEAKQSVVEGEVNNHPVPCTFSLYFSISP